MLDYENASADADIRFERTGDVLTIKLPKEGFARGAGNLLRSGHFWIVIGLMLFIVNLGDVARWVWLFRDGRFSLANVRPQYVALLFLQPAILVCTYATMIGQIATTVRLQRTELVCGVRGLFGFGRETGYARREITGVHVGWFNLSLALDRRSWFGVRLRANVFYGRTRDERERVASAIRNWLETTPPDPAR